MGQPFDLAMPLLGHVLDQKLANCVLQVKSGPLFDFVNKVLLECCHANSFTYCLWPHLC